MFDFLATLLGWLDLEPTKQAGIEPLEDIAPIHGDESANLLGIMDPDG